MSNASGTPSCVSPLDIEEDVTNGGKVKIVGCDARYGVLNGATELASYTVTIYPADTACRQNPWYSSWVPLQRRSP